MRRYPEDKKDLGWRNPETSVSSEEVHTESPAEASRRSTTAPIVGKKISPVKRDQKKFNEDGIRDVAVHHVRVGCCMRHAYPMDDLRILRGNGRDFRCGCVMSMLMGKFWFY